MLSLLLFIFLLFHNWVWAMLDDVSPYFAIDASYPFKIFLFGYRNPNWTYKSKLRTNKPLKPFVWLIFAELS
jgi:hypothetical protein